MEESIQSSSTLADCLPPVYSINALEMPGSRCADSFCNQIEGENGVAGRLILSKGQPPPPYSENIKTFQADVSFSDPPKYDDARSSTTTHVTANVDKPLDINLVYVTSRQAAFNVVELIICLIGLSTTALFKESESGHIYSDLTTFFLFLMIASTLLIVANMWLNFISCFIHFPSRTNHLKVVFLLVVIGILLAATSVIILCMMNTLVCEQESELHGGCILHWVSVVCGLLVAIIFWLDATVQVKNMINDKS